MSFDPITTHPHQLGGAPCIRSPRISVSVVIDMVGIGLSTAEILDLYPDLEAEDIHQALHFAAEALQSAKPAPPAP
jgi:uncharacterized protein (DUF433 family)